MRRATSDKKIITDDSNNKLGICLGYDYCAEHEWGIKDIYSNWGIDTDLDGYDSRKISVVPDNYVHGKKKIDGKDAFYIGSFRVISFDNNREERLKEALKHRFSQMSFYCDETISSMWDSNGFLFATTDEGTYKMLVSAIEQKDLVICLSSNSNPFAGSGINLIVYSKIPKELKMDAIRQSNSQKKLTDAVEKSGIKKKLADYGKKYYALSPRWDSEKENTFSFWLNPSDQANNNHGWFTIQDLEDWIDEKGKIPKKPQGQYDDSDLVPNPK